jgi:transcriptional regulator with XRE-family HTH domain
MRQALENYGIRLERAASHLDVSVDTLKRYLTGETNPSAIQVWQFAQLLGEPVGIFIGENEVAIPEDLDAEILAGLLDTLEKRNRADARVIGEIRTLLLEKA